MCLYYYASITIWAETSLCEDDPYVKNLHLILDYYFKYYITYLITIFGTLIYIVNVHIWPKRPLLSIWFYVYTLKVKEL